MNSDNLKASIDNQLPQSILENLYKPQLLDAEIKRVLEIDKENFELMKKLCLIYKTKGKIDCWRKKFEESINHDKFTAKKQKYLEIDERNKEIYGRLETIQNRNKIDSKKDKNKKKFHKIIRKIIVENSQPAKLIEAIKKLNSRPRCFFELRFEESKLFLGKIIIELYSDIAPKTCANFLAYCLGTNNGLCYKNTLFYKIISGYLCQGGDVIKLNGTGSTSIYDETEFECENFNLKHDVPGILSTAFSTDNTANSKFNLTFKKLQVLNNKCVVFGKIASGLSNIYKIDACGTQIGRPKKKIIISNCGLY